MRPVLLGKMVKRKMKFFWFVQTSKNMKGWKIDTLNQAMKQSIEELKNILKSRPEIDIDMYILEYSSGSKWVIGPNPVNINDLSWNDLEARDFLGGNGPEMVVNELKDKKMSKRGLPPVILLVGQEDATHLETVRIIESVPWGRKAVRVAISVGDYDKKALDHFTNLPEKRILSASNPQELLEYIKWASVSASISSYDSKILEKESDVF